MPSLRELARSLGLSHTTVSEALRDSPRVKAATRRRVLRAAQAVGYRANPLAGALMSEMRRARSGTFRGVLALVDVDETELRPVVATRFHHELAAGAAARATELGFQTELFALKRRGVTLERLDGILQSRGIRGILLLPLLATRDLSGLDWSRYAAIYADYVLERPALHTVCSDHYRAMAGLLPRLAERGYRRPGLVLHDEHDRRVLYRWQAAFHTFLEQDGASPAPALVRPDLRQDEFTAWFNRTRPDVVLSHRPEVLDWMEAAGAAVPGTHGFCCLNLLATTRACAGLDLQPALIGARGMELLIGQMLRNEYGLPTVPSTTMIPAAWTDGATLRQPQPARG